MIGEASNIMSVPEQRTWCIVPYMAIFTKYGNKIIPNGHWEWPLGIENVFRAAHCDAKKNFIKRLRAIAKTYEDNAISEAVTAAEVNRNTIWKMLRSKKRECK